MARIHQLSFSERVWYTTVKVARELEVQIKKKMAMSLPTVNLLCEIHERVVNVIP